MSIKKLHIIDWVLKVAIIIKHSTFSEYNDISVQVLGHVTGFNTLHIFIETFFSEYGLIYFI